MNTLMTLLQMLVLTIKTSFVAKEDGKGLSANDLTNTLKSNYDAAHTHSQSAHAPSGAQANIIESIKVNGAALTVNGKAVDISVPTKVSDLTNDSGFQTATNLSAAIAAALASYSNTTDMMAAIMSAIGSAGHLKRAIVASLPAVGSANTDTIYMMLKAAGKGDNLYDEFMVISGKWEKIGDTEVDLTGYLKESDIEAITLADIQAMFAN